MSMATKQQECLQTFQNNNYNEQQVSTIHKERQPPSSSSQWNRKKSIETTIKSEKHVTKVKQLARQTPVVIFETEAEGEEKVATLKDIHDDDDNDKNYFIKEADYQIYQDGNVNEFFKEDIKEAPKTIADICLVNDHYILVKMTEYEKNGAGELGNATGDIQSKDLIDNREQTAKALRENLQRDNRKFCSYLHSKRNRITRIAPIHEEPEDSLPSEGETLEKQSKLHCLKGYSCWQAKEEEVEIYQSRTTIKKSPQNPISIVNKKSSNSTSILQDCQEIQPHKELETISGSLIKSSLQRQVSIHSYGSLISAENNNNNNMDITHCHKGYPLPPPPDNLPPLPRRKCPRFESLYWLLRPFRGKYRKPKPKIQAVVYKTYFVKWTKPPDTLTHGYGVKSSNFSDMGVSVLRRCRSAVF